MTKKDYVKFAHMLNDLRPRFVEDTAASTWEDLRERTIRIFTEDNPNFDRARFVAATEKR